ncbi:MAG TPA: restriction endonuclease subunit S, partial [Terriglobales bacterium]|nr:restriction endonuclease subunit S [Terriglobales bacterium]
MSTDEFGPPKSYERSQAMRRDYSRQTIADLCDFINGNGFRPTDWRTSGLPIIRIQNLNGTESFNYYDGPTKPDWLVEPGDLLYAWAGVKGVSFGPTIWPGPRGVLNQHIYKVVPRANIDRYWLYLVLKHVTGEIEAQAHGFKSSLVHVHKEDITGQAVELPPIDEQRRIAALLRTWDEAIQKLGSLHAAKVLRRDGVAQTLLARVQSPHKRRTNGWKKVTFGAVFSERQDRNLGLDSEAVVTVGKYAIRKQSEHFTR